MLGFVLTMAQLRCDSSHGRHLTPHDRFAAPEDNSYVGGQTGAHHLSRLRIRTPSSNLKKHYQSSLILTVNYDIQFP